MNIDDGVYFTLLMRRGEIIYCFGHDLGLRPNPRALPDMALIVSPTGRGEWLDLVAEGDDDWDDSE